jgi:hypothetical protein
LAGLDASGELSHMITVEDCYHCTGHTHARETIGAVVIFSITISTKGLIAALLRFRASYFGNEEFLPRPFRRDELDAAWTFGR